MQDVNIEKAKIILLSKSFELSQEILKLAGYENTDNETN